MTNLPDNNDSPEKTQADSIATPRKGFDGASAQDRRHTNLFHERERETPSQTPPESNGVRPLRGPATAALSDNQAGASLQDFFDILHRQRWKLAAFIALSLAAATLVSLWLTPLYESSLAINVERRGNGVVGQEASAPSMSEMDQIMMTQVQLIESDPVLRPVAEEYHLLELENQFRFLDRAESGRLRKSKTILKRLKVTRAPNTSILRISYRAPDPKMAADIVTMIAKTYVEHAFDSREQSNSAVLTVVEGQLSDLHQKIVSSRRSARRIFEATRLRGPRAARKCFVRAALATELRLHDRSIRAVAKANSLQRHQIRKYSQRAGFQSELDDGQRADSPEPGQERIR